MYLHGLYNVPPRASFSRRKFEGFIMVRTTPVHVDRPDAGFIIKEPSL